LTPLLAFHGWLFEPFSGMTAVLMAGLCGLLYGASENSLRARELADWLAGRMTDSQINKFLNTPDSANLGAKRELTVLTCRILNHSDLGTQLAPAVLEKAVTEFMHEAAKTVIAKGAYLDACNVEGVRAVFGLVDSNGEQSLEACRAALALQRHLDGWTRASQNKIAFGIALATGPMSAGIFGHDNFAQLSVLGEPLDFSRRLCSINHVYGSHVLISARTYQMTKDSVEARPMEMVSAPRMHQISEVYELLAEKGKLTDEQTKARDAFWQGVVSLRKGAYKEAIGHLKRAELAGLEDAPLKYFLDRAEAAVREDEEESTGRPTAKHVRVLTAN
jgi:class 3 adenylate cyclase